MEAVNPVAKAIRIAGNQMALAKAIGCPQNRISDWLRRGWAPIEVCPAIEKATGVTVTELVDAAARAKAARKNEAA